MDPLSISVSVITLIQTVGKVSTSLAGFVQSVRQVDSRLSSLCAELTKLAGFLDAVDRTLKQCEQRNVLLSPIDEDVWYQSASVLDDCKGSLAELEALAVRIKTTAARSGRPWRNTRAAIDLTAHASDIESLQDKIHKSNWALQTMLAVFNVSLSLRGNASQNMILVELADLKRAIEHATLVARPTTTSSTRVSGNLHNLARAARQFHSQASTTASTIYGDRPLSTIYGERPARVRNIGQSAFSDLAMSTAGEMTAIKHERIEEYLRDSPAGAPPTRQNSLSMSSRFAAHEPFDAFDPESLRQQQQQQQQQQQRPQSVERPSAWAEGDLASSPPPPLDLPAPPAMPDVDSDLELLLLDGLENLAVESFLNSDFAKAASQLDRALNGHARFHRSDRPASARRLRIQLSLCYFMQGKWREAEPLVRQLADSTPDSDPISAIVPDLLHALSLAYLRESAFDVAMKLCRQSLNMKKLFGSTGDEYHQTMGLLAAIYDKQKDQSEYGVIIRRKLIPPWFVYHHPEGPAHFLGAKARLLETAFGQDVVTRWHVIARNKAAVELDATPITSRLLWDQQEVVNMTGRGLSHSTSNSSTLRNRSNVHFDNLSDAGESTPGQERYQTGTLLSRALTKIRFGSQRRRRNSDPEPRVAVRGVLIGGKPERTSSLDREVQKLRRSASRWFRPKSQRPVHPTSSDSSLGGESSFRVLSVRSSPGSPLYDPCTQPIAPRCPPSLPYRDPSSFQAMAPPTVTRDSPPGDRIASNHSSQIDCLPELMGDLYFSRAELSGDCLPRDDIARRYQLFNNQCVDGDSDSLRSSQPPSLSSSPTPSVASTPSLSPSDLRPIPATECIYCYKCTCFSTSDRIETQPKGNKDPWPLGIIPPASAPPNSGSSNASSTASTPIVPHSPNLNVATIGLTSSVVELDSIPIQGTSSPLPASSPGIQSPPPHIPLQYMQAWKTIDNPHLRVFLDGEYSDSAWPPLDLDGKTGSDEAGWFGQRAVGVGLGNTIVMGMAGGNGAISVY